MPSCKHPAVVIANMHVLLAGVAVVAVFVLRSAVRPSNDVRDSIGGYGTPSLSMSASRRCNETADIVIPESCQLS
jgi:hypothetical protein